MFNPEKPSLDELTHHGIKGQKWGVTRNSEGGGSGSGASAKPKPQTRDEKIAAYAAKNGITRADTSKNVAQYKNLKTAEKSKKDAMASLKENQSKSLNKLDPPEGSKQGLTPAQKKALITAAVGAVVVGGLIAYSVHSNQKATALDLHNLQQLHLKADHEAKQAVLSAKKSAVKAALKETAGQSVQEDLFKQGVSISQSQTWGFKGYIQDSSFREGFSLPAGHTFHRITTTAETTFDHNKTYSVHNIEDFHRYVSGFSGEKGGIPLHHVTFKSTSEIKVPSLADTLDTVREVLDRNAGTPGRTSPLAAKTAYERWSGGGWGKGAGKELLDALEKKGYNGLVDEMDAGVIGESPVIVFGNTFGPKSSTPLTSEDFKTAGHSLIEITNRKT